MTRTILAEEAIQTIGELLETHKRDNDITIVERDWAIIDGLI